MVTNIINQYSHYQYYTSIVTDPVTVINIIAKIIYNQYHQSNLSTRIEHPTCYWLPHVTT